MRTFDFYEFTGVIAPGAVVLFSVSLLYPQIRTVPTTADLTVGGLGIFVILAYVVGHLTQAIGNAIEWLWWKAWGGMPSDWVRHDRQNLIAPIQVQALESKLPSQLGLQSPIEIRKMTSGNWFAITRQMHAAVAAQSRATRVEFFNGNYGLNRGIASALLIVSAVMLVDSWALWRTAAMCLAGAVIALYRMHRFGKHYARELFIQFLQLP